MSWASPKSTVLMTTYNDDLRMEITLRSFMRQVTKEPFDVVIVNDGGHDETVDMLARVWREFRMTPTAIRRPWGNGLVGLQYYYLNPPSPDFRLAAARNLGLRHILTPQTVICDCDTAAGPKMVSEHQDNFFENQDNFFKNTVLIGVRKHVRREAVEQAAQFTTLGMCDQEWLFQNAYRDDDRLDGNMELRAKYAGVATYPRPWEVCWGCNFSFPTERAHRIGGFDEDFVGWGGEDDDIARRMFRDGARFKPIPESYVYHLDHHRRTTQVASHTFHKKFNADVIRGGPMQLEAPVYLGRI